MIHGIQDPGQPKTKQTTNYENVLSSSGDTNQSSSLTHNYKNIQDFLFTLGVPKANKNAIRAGGFSLIGLKNELSI